MKTNDIIKRAAKRGYTLKITYNGTKGILAYKNMRYNKYNSFNDFYNKVLKTEMV